MYFIMYIQLWKAFFYRLWFTHAIFLKWILPVNTDNVMTSSFQTLIAQVFIKQDCRICGINMYSALRHRHPTFSFETNICISVVYNKAYLCAFDNLDYSSTMHALTVCGMFLEINCFLKVFKVLCAARMFYCRLFVILLISRILAKRRYICFIWNGIHGVCVQHNSAQTKLL